MRSPRRFVVVLCVLGVAAALATTAIGDPDAVEEAPAPGAVVDPYELLISRQLAETFGLSKGDLVRLSTEPSGAGARSFRVAGTYEPVPDPMRFAAPRLEARLHLPDLIDLIADPRDPLSAESVDAINVALVRPEDARDFAQDLSARVPGLLVQTTMRSDEDNPFVALERFHLAIAIVTVAASTVFLLALMVMLVNERQQTVGILRLIGLPRSRILVQVLLEGLMVASAGTLFGLLLAVAAQPAINQFFQWRYDTALVFVRITPEIAWRCAALALPLGVLASVAASWTVLRREVLVLTRR
jgi:putative ABC transport system permease protein